MLMLTDKATAVIETLVQQPALPDGAGLRIATTSESDGDPLSVTTAATPEATDQVLEEQGARIFLDPGAAVMLEDKVLDAEITDEGRVQFLLADRPG